MARPTRASFGTDLSAEDQISALLSLATGKNPDGSDFALPVEIAAVRGADLFDQDVSAANAAVLSVLPAPGAGLSIYLTHIEVSFSAAPTGAPVLTVESPDATVLYRRLLSAQAPPSLDFAVPLKMPANTECRVEVPAAGVAVVTHLAIAGFAAA